MIFAGIEKISLVDYKDYLTCVVFTPGCNFRCPFCQNSSLVTSKGSAEIDEEEVLEYLEKKKKLLDAFGITGGEPTLHKGIERVYERVKELGLKTKLDTNGTNPELVRRLIDRKLVDYVALDIKNSLDDYLPIIGMKNFDLTPVNETAALLLENKTEYEFRTTLVKEFHTERNIEQIGKDLKGAEKFFFQKFADRGTCLEEGLHACSDEQTEEFIKILSKYVKFVGKRGFD